MEQKLLELLHDNIDSLKLPKTIKGALKTIKFFTLGGKKESGNQSYSENSAGSEMPNSKAISKGKSKASSSS